LFAEAIAQLDRLIATAKPSRGHLQLLLALKGQLYFSLNDTRRSVTLIDQAIALNPESESARRAQNAKYEVARLLAKRTPQPKLDSRSDAASPRSLKAHSSRGARLRLSQPAILAIRCAFLAQENLRLGAGISAASRFKRE
jgi:hypothetical protein